MSVLTRLPAIVNEVGITSAQLGKAMAESLEVREGVIRKAKEVQQYWVEIAPESDRPEHPVQVGGAETIAPGDYKKSIKIKFERGRGPLVAIVYSDAPHARWLEYGSIHNLAPKIGYAQKVADHFNSVEFAGRV